MTTIDDPRAILKAAGVECAEVDRYLAEPDETVAVVTCDGQTVPMRVWKERPDADAAILALAKIVAKDQWMLDEYDKLAMVLTAMPGTVQLAERWEAERHA